MFINYVMQIFIGLFNSFERDKMLSNKDLLKTLVRMILVKGMSINYVTLIFIGLRDTSICLIEIILNLLWGSQ